MVILIYCQSPGKFQKHKNPATLPYAINLHGNIAYDQVRPGTTDISLHSNVAYDQVRPGTTDISLHAYEHYHHEQDPADDHHYERLDECST